jgi:alkylated DNA repair protein (DNA oxidative demethylase)
MARTPEISPPEGLRHLPGFLDPAEALALSREIDRLSYQPVVMRGVTARRSVLHYGWDYGYDSWTIRPTEPVPDFLRSLRARCADLIATDPESLAEVLVSRYPAGAGIGWHRDAPMFGKVIGVSLGAPCMLRLRPPGEGRRPIHSLRLEPRSAYVLTGEARRKWQHSIPPVKALRWSISFRTLLRVPAAVAAA